MGTVTESVWKSLGDNSEVVGWDHSTAFGFPLVIERTNDRQIGFVSPFENVAFACGVVSVIEGVDVLLGLSTVGFAFDDIVELAVLEKFPVLFDWIFDPFF